MVKKLFSKKTFLITLVVCVAVALLVLIIWTFNFYPVALVNFRPIMAGDYQKSVDLTIKYLGLTAATSTLTIKEAVLEGLIDEVGIDRELQKTSSSKEIQQFIDSQTSAILGDSTVQNSLASRSITVSDAAKYLLTPAIKNQMLSDQLTSKGIAVLSWITDNRKNLNVIILMPSVHWTGSGIRFD